MASGDLYEVEKIVDKRKNKKGRWEYLIRWRGYGSREDTWEPEHHLLHCDDFIEQYNQLQRRRRRAGAARGGPATPTRLSRPGGREPPVARGDPRKKKRTSGAAGGGASGCGVGQGAGLGAEQKQRKLSDSKHGGARVGKVPGYKTLHGGLQFVTPPRGAANGLQNGEAEALHYRTEGRGDGMLGQEMGGATQTLGRDMDSPLSNGGVNLPSSAKRKLVEDKGYVFDKRLRYSVRQNDTNCRFRDIVVRKEDGFTHVLLSSQTTDNNALTPEIMKEVCRALGNAAVDDSKLLLLSAVGRIFCWGLDLSYLIGRLSTDRRKESSRIADAVRDFVNSFIRFKKPIVVAINGPALGLGASILPLCDVVWASERAWFQTPCASLRLTPSGCSSYTFPQILGVALANEMLFCGRKLTAQEACSRGLVSQVFWPTTFNQEVMLRVREMAACSAVVLEESKSLVRGVLRAALEEVNEKECAVLRQLWCSTQGLEALFSYLQNKGFSA